MSICQHYLSKTGQKHGHLYFCGILEIDLSRKLINIDYRPQSTILILHCNNYIVFQGISFSIFTIFTIDSLKNSTFSSKIILFDCKLCYSLRSCFFLVLVVLGHFVKICPFSSLFFHFPLA